MNVVESYTAGEVMDFTVQKRASDRDQARAFHVEDESTQAEPQPPSSVIVIDSKMTPLEAATLLWENFIMGAPVYDADRKTYVGMFDVRDILSCVNAAHREFVALGIENPKPGQDTHLPTYGEINRAMQRERLATALQHMKIDSKPSTPGAVTVTYLAARNPMPPVFYTKESSLLDICKVLTARHKHRVCIGNSSAARAVCEGILSQSSIVAFIASKCPKGSLDEKMTDAGLDFRKDVVKIADSASAAEAFELLDSKRLSGIAVVDEDGKLVGTTSAKDIKRAVLDAGRTSMDMDILSYLASVRQSEAVTKKDKYPSVHVHDDATVEHVVNLIAKTGLHRVFVVDKDMKPVGVVSFTDIINFVIKPAIPGV